MLMTSGFTETAANFLTRHCLWPWPERVVKHTRRHDSNFLEEALRSSPDFHVISFLLCIAVCCLLCAIFCDEPAQHLVWQIACNWLFHKLFNDAVSAVEVMKHRHSWEDDYEQWIHQNFEGVTRSVFGNIIRHSFGKNHEMSQLRCRLTVSRLRFDPCSSWIQVISISAMLTRNVKEDRGVLLSRFLI